MSKFKAGDKVRTVRHIKDGCDVPKHTTFTVQQYKPQYEYPVITIEGTQFADDELELVPEVYLCDTCGKANVSCPIYPPKSCPECVEYVVRKAEPKTEKEVITEMLSESVTSGLPNAEQILPTQGNQNVPLELIRFILQRDKKGQDTYGSSLMSNNGRDALRDALEEALDLCQYLMQMYLERGGEDASK